MCRPSQQVYRPTSTTQAQARQFLISHLKGDLAGTVALDDAVLAVTELVTNAVNAGSGRVVVDIDLHRDRLLLAVTDDAVGRPEIQPMAPLATHGRGLRIVDALSLRWGTDPRPIGKRVWVELAVDPDNTRECWA